MQSLIDAEERAIERYERNPTPAAERECDRAQAALARRLAAPDRVIVRAAYICIRGASRRRIAALNPAQRSAARDAAHAVVVRNDALPRSVRRIARLLDVDDDVSVRDDCTLETHQEEGVDFIMQRHRAGVGAIVAFSMGLGKTLTALVALQRIIVEAEQTRFVVVTPTGVVDAWRDEWAKYAWDYDVVVATTAHEAADVVCDMQRDGCIALVVSFDTLVGMRKHRAKHFGILARLVDVVVVDEMHKLKNLETRRARAVDCFATRVRIGLTGTPVSNSPADYYNIARLVDPSVVASVPPEAFSRDYDVSRGPLDAARCDALKRLIAPITIRRTSDILREHLPPKRETVVVYTVDPTVIRRVDDAPYLQKQPMIDSLARETKVGVAKRFLDRLDATDAALVFSTHPATLHAIAASTPRTRVLDGSLPPSRRRTLVAGFADGEYDVLCISTGAGGTGLNCQRANVVLLLEPRENPTDDAQAVHRAWRLGQMRSVDVYRMAAANTVDVRILCRGMVKTALSHRLVDDRGVDVAVARVDDVDDATSLVLQPVAASSDARLRGIDGVEGWHAYEDYFEDDDRSAPPDVTVHLKEDGTAHVRFPKGEQHEVCVQCKRAWSAPSVHTRPRIVLKRRRHPFSVRIRRITPDVSMWRHIIV